MEIETSQKSEQQKKDTGSAKPGSKTRSAYSFIPASLRRTRNLLVVGLLLLSTGAGYLGGLAGAHNNSQVSNSGPTRQVVTSEGQLLNQIAKDVGSSVVSIDVTSQATVQSFFGFSQSTPEESAGTGIILNADGLIITNRHVVEGTGASFSVTLSDGTKLDNVELVGATASNDSLDIAFLKIKDAKGHKLTPAKLADSSKVQVGDRVVAIGNALGQFQNTVTSGIISGYGRQVSAGDGTSASSETLQNLFQTDAAINHGNSGGPLVNMSGEVIGINTAIAGDAQDIGFAIPINDVSGLISSVEKNGKLERPYLGVHYVMLTDDLAYQFNVDTKRGAYVIPSSGGSSSIVPGSPADKAGIKEKDIITKINDASIDENNSLTSVLGHYQVGDKVKITVIRDGKTLSLEITLAAAPAQ